MGIKIDLNEEEREFLFRVVDRALKLCIMCSGKTEFLKEPFSWVSDVEKAEKLKEKLSKKHEI